MPTDHISAAFNNPTARWVAITLFGITSAGTGFFIQSWTSYVSNKVSEHSVSISQHSVLLERLVTLTEMNQRSDISSATNIARIDERIDRMQLEFTMQITRLGAKLGMFDAQKSSD